MSAGAQSRCLSLSMKRSLSEKAASTDRVLARVIACLAGSELLAGCPGRNRLLSKNITLLQARSTPRPLTGFSLSQASFIWNGLPGPQENILSGACVHQLCPAALAQLHGESGVGTVAPESLSALWPMGFPLGFCSAMDFMASLM